MRGSFRDIALAVIVLWVLAFEALGQPSLEVTTQGLTSVRISWDDPSESFQLESTLRLGAEANWQMVPAAPSVQGTRRTLDLPIENSARFFRVRSAAGAPLTTVLETSPAGGESAVSVNRETVFYLTQPLGSGLVVPVGGLFAEAAGRRVLSRTEISADRLLVSLFYMEPLPPGARVRVTFDGAGLMDNSGRPLDLDGDGQPGGTTELMFETVNTTILAKTAVMGRILASEKGPGGVEVPLQGVTITVDGREETLRTTTAADGTFHLEPCPAGRFFVNVDGRTAVGSSWPNGAYYPLLGKAWEAEAGKTNNLAGGTGIIYLPLVAAGTLQAISSTAETRVTFPDAVLAQNPELNGVEIMVPPNGLFSDDGIRGGMVGLAPVASDRLPEPLPAGLTHALDISIQTSGAQNFDRPVPAKFPNLPDPVTGQKLPPGAKTALWSFNHDTGRWEMQGSMTVTEDGNFVVTDPGVGIRQPGWHGTSPGSSGSGGPGGGGPPCSPPGILKEGTSECDKDDCPEDSKNKQQECFAEATRCALKCYEKCGKPSPIRKILKAIKVGRDCYLATQCSVVCKTEGERCFDRWMPCVTGSGGPPPPGLRAQALEADAVALEGQRILAHQEQYAALFAELFAILDKAPEFDDLSPADQIAADAIAGQLDALFDNKPMTQYIVERQRRFAQIVLQSPLADAIYPPVKGYYVLVDLQSGLVRRGRTEPRGYLNGIILRPDADYRIQLLLGPTLDYHETEFTSASAGVPTFIPYGSPLVPAATDLDGDGIPASAEFVLGTRDDRADSDEDGVNDFQELKNNTDPLDGQPSANGIIASLDTPGDAVDIAIAGNLAMIADSAAGVALIDITDPLRPSLLAQLDTPGTALASALTLTRGVVADDAGGIVILDLSNPAQPVAVGTLATPAGARAATVSGGVAYVGLANGTIVAVDLFTATEVARLAFPESLKIEDLAVQDELLYVWAAGRLHVLSISTAGLEWLRSVNASVAGGRENRRMRLSVAAGRAYACYPAGVVIFDLQNPDEPTLLERRNTTQNGWKQIVLALPDLAIAADGLNLVNDEPQDVSLYDLGPDGTELNFLANFTTPGVSTALILDRGYAVLADGQAGLQVISFTAADTAGIPPTLEVRATFPLNPAEIESNQPGRITAIANDDVKVREVEFYINGEVALVDKNWPFELSFTAPERRALVGSFRFLVRAIDTAGNATASPEVEVALLPDTTPPRVVSVSPRNDTVAENVSIVLARFSEPLDIGLLNPSRVRLSSDGTDLVFDTADDQAVIGSVGYSANSMAALLEFATPLPNGRFRFNVDGVLDLGGNVQTQPHVSYFWIAPGGATGDPDGDGLSNEEESAAGTSPFAEDTDADGWADEVEVHDGSDPRDPSSTPRSYRVARPRLNVLLADPAEVIGSPGLIVARPMVTLLIEPATELAIGPWVAIPSLNVLISSRAEEVLPGPWIAKPGVEIRLVPEAEEAATRPIVARPPLTVKLNTP
jgi:hypothetical protein